jgi:class 3 adenylate cyclase
MDIDFDSLTLTEIIRLQNQLSAVLSRRFEKRLAVVFSDIIGSTAYFSRYGDQAGHRIQQQHIDLWTGTLSSSSKSDGRLVSSAGDGLLLTFSRVQPAVESAAQYHRALTKLHSCVPPEQYWTSRTCIHWGPILTDGTTVAGDAVNLCAKLAACIPTQEIQLTKQAMMELPKQLAVLCRPRDCIQLPGLSEPFEVYSFMWQTGSAAPSWMIIEQTGEQIELPDKAIISCGRLREHQQRPANDIVLQLPDSHLTQQISRWHFELRREADQLYLRSLTDQPTEVNGVLLQKGEQALVEVGAVVRLSHVMTLRFETTDSPSSAEDPTLPYTRSM